ncbi:MULTISPECIES: dienelactone hydrolase family protein [Acidocella]|uniref:dienelactone hydrolase family protein n=1 Tax=Acidocella TaxID=50709 RepID=UPI00028DA8E4|nr:MULTISPECIES: dienelactone hydrolase family protein [Acidocella]EKM99543.1 carboxymethylenebutenolidase [Acidocella sp. MX-AZ02]WBO58183.1 dienelactone hydrolase family protein [Acidocella sp. MX-AZ03]
MREIKLKAADQSGEFSAFVWEPKGLKAGKEAGAVVVIQEIFGVNDSLRETAASLAEQGFITIAPDLFWRLEPGVNISDKSDAEWQKAFDLMNRFDQDKGIEDLKTTLAEARELPGCNGNAGTIGFCLGGRLAVMMATRSDSDVNVSYYGVGLDSLLPEFDRIQAPLMLHIADEDEFFPAEGREKLIEGLEGNEWVDAFVFPEVQHAFARVGGVHYDARAATIANGHTTELLAEILD